MRIWPRRVLYSREIISDKSNYIDTDHTELDQVLFDTRWEIFFFFDGGKPLSLKLGNKTI